MVSIRSLAVLGSIGLAPFGAFAICMYAGANGHLKDIPDKMNVADYLDPTDPKHFRMEADDYAKAMHADLDKVNRDTSGTGVIRCGNEIGSANIGGPQGTTTTVTAGHILINPVTCQPRSRPEDCRYFPKIGDQEFGEDGTPLPPGIRGEARMRLGAPMSAEFVRIGFDCHSRPLATEDWAVLKLKRPIKFIQPYHFASVPEEEWQHKALLAVAAQSIDFPGKRHTFPKSLANCHQKDSQAADGTFLEKVNCGVGVGGSGGGLLNPLSGRQVPTMVGIISDFSEGADHALVQQEINTNVPISRPYDSENWRTVSIPLRGRLWDAINESFTYTTSDVSN